MNNMKWIKANMPWSSSGSHDYSTMPKEPDIDDRIKEKFGITQDEAFEKYLTGKTGKSFHDCPEYDEIDAKISDWKFEEPEYIEWNKLCKEWDEKQDQIKKDNPTFCGNNLNKAGTLIKLEDNRVFLIGHINRNCGVCDDCVGFSGNAVIKEYSVIYEKSNEL